MKHYRLLILWIVGTLYMGGLVAQDDKKTLSKTSLFTTPKDSSLSKTPAADTVTQAPVVKIDSVIKHDPRKATRRSAILPGWGQAYNKQYWKIPIVYGLLAIPASFYVYNNNYYKKTKFAYEARYKEQNGDPSDVPYIDPELNELSMADLQNYRNQFRRDRDYSVLWFVLAWGLQVVDATVFGHLKDFNVSNDLSMQISPVFNPQTRTPALSLTFNLKNSSNRRAITR
jgi:hypothetical protein